MKYTIVGAGAIGGCLGAKLALAGEEVTFIARNRNLEAINARGMTLHLPDGSTQQASNVRAVQDTAEAGPQDVVLLTTKAHQLLDLVPGMQIMLLCKATAVRISRLQLEKPGTNKAYGKVTRHSRAKATEISLQIAPHISLIGFAEDEQIKTGETVYAYLEDSSLVLALV